MTSPLTPRRLGCLATLMAIAIAVAAPAFAQDKFPSRTIRVISSTGAGSGPDVIARIIAEHISQDLGQTLVMENNPTGGGLVAAQQVAGASPDGYTLMSASASVFTVLPVRQERAPRLGAQLRAVAYYGDLPLIVCVPPSLGVNTFAELLALAKREPKKILYAGNANGSLPHMSGVLINTRAGGGFTFVPYRSASDGLNDIMTGQINMIIEGVAPLGGALQAGTIKPLAVTMSKRMPALPDVPTLSEVFPGLVAQGWAGLVAPAGTADAIVNQINAAHNRAVQKPEVRKRLEELGAFIRPLSPQEMTAFIESEQKQWTPVVREVSTSQAAPASSSGTK